MNFVHNKLQQHGLWYSTAIAAYLPAQGSFITRGDNKNIPGNR